MSVPKHETSLLCPPASYSFLLSTVIHCTIIQIQNMCNMNRWISAWVIRHLQSSTLGFKSGPSPSCDILCMTKLAPHFSTLAWQIPWTEEPGGPQSMGSLRVGHDRATSLSFTFHFHALEKEMATHSSVLAWSIPGTGEPGGLPSMGSHRVRHDWSDFAAAAANFPISVSSSVKNIIMILSYRVTVRI